MGDGGFGMALLFPLGAAVVAASMAPLLVIAAFSRLRSRLFLWMVGLTLPALVVLFVAAEARYVAGNVPFVGAANALGYAFAAVPLILAASVPRWRRGFAYAWAPLALAVAFGAVQQRRMELAERLLAAAQRGDGPEVRRLLDQGAGPDCWEPGHCAIDLSIERKDWTTVEALIEHGATDATYRTGEDVDGAGPGTTTSVALGRGGRPDLAQRLQANGP